ncbi:hypothetical protein ACFQH6_12285 [Halobacteriaceae archaeon GCM10025711]
MGRTTASGYLSTESLTGIHWLAVVLVLATAILHLYAGVVEARPPLTLAGLGYLGAIALFLVDYRRRLLYVTGIAYTAIQVVLWVALRAGEFTMVGYVDKAVQVALIVVLAYLYQRERSERASVEQAPAA